MAEQHWQTFSPKRALLSVSDKQGIVSLAKLLNEYGVELVATGNTAVILREQGLAVTDVSDYTGFPEIMNGRVKTLHPAIHAGILARGEQDSPVLQQHGIKAFDLVIVNLYPFEQTISNPECNFDSAIENIDIGGPSMIRGAAKNHAHVSVIVSPADYDKLSEYIKAGKKPAHWNFELAKKAFAHTAAYDAAIANYFGTLNENKIPSGFPDTLTCQFTKHFNLRYGENPHQQAAFYLEKKASPHSLARAEIIQGKELSYNNLLDADAGFDTIKSFTREQPVCVIVKHGNPCGIAQAKTQLQAYIKAYECDPVSAYGGILAFNGCLEAETAQNILSRQFAEVIIAPAISAEAKVILAGKPNIRVLVTGGIAPSERFELDSRRVEGGLLIQEHDSFPIASEQFKIVTRQLPSEQQKEDLLFAWAAVKHVKSNAIVLAKHHATIGIGAGQTSRVMSTRIALWQAKERQFDCRQAVMASDAFIPFADSVEMAIEAGITAIIQPGGSIRDNEVIEVANAAGISMIFTGFRHFRH
ncbi:bifunctional phosphoribosylaminoimidazolecarboxamide formyltransferase/IMP cyclohydrolase [Legionella quinlivanii]|uniref:Bifunctional purine biosynthesis protein PurH n=1 Tax=Legionella quinlivanii TaxID=45073 RepID=A0A0W0XSI3_9GAMM|nr:bifunctional phosphoribosylaminoimidazolecarboxamide formyltransferase/IMP cyclohydrolase [Legionella quinlivanii]KTD47414.1 bifunctional phosphoribosylaminoimidazolecarboxamide formyltransferase/IMP cyclohydrolase [Legionella quinlivanii]SEG38154.1 IMP cyclohydrolase [Legionella quinlivanii DSM 21216]STY10027.1 phosphoribosylaminoimidazolecarboxamide formyltransferase [Legionella quinlivanii]